MKSFVFALAAVISSLSMFAQIPNSTFNQGNESSILDWKTVSGSAGISSSFSFKTSFGDTTVKGDFALLKYSGENAAAITSTFAWNQRSDELKGSFIYIPNSDFQRFTIEITYLDWVPALLKNDTMAVVKTKVNPFNNNKFKNYNWFTLSIPIGQDNFFLNGDPDSCTISIYADNGDQTDISTILLIDELEFGAGLVASVNQSTLNSISIYPNPCWGNFNIQGVEPNQMIDILSVEGKLLSSVKALETINLNLNKGMYIIRFDIAGAAYVKKLIVD